MQAENYRISAVRLFNGGHRYNIAIDGYVKGDIIDLFNRNGENIKSVGLLYKFCGFSFKLITFCYCKPEGIIIFSLIYFFGKSVEGYKWSFSYGVSAIGYSAH